MAEAKKRSQVGEIGSTGLKRYSGYVNEEFLTQLQGSRGAKIYREMSTNDPVIVAILFAIDMLIRQAEWTVEPASEDPDDTEMSDFLQSCMNDMSMSWSETISEIMSMLVYGWSYHEIVYKRRLGLNRDRNLASKHDDGRIGWAKLPIRAQETLHKWEFSDGGDVTAMVQQAPPDFQQRVVPMEKAVLFRTKVHKNNPEGHSILRGAYRPWYFKKRIEEIEAIGIERDLAGFPVMRVDPELLDPNAPAEKKAALNYWVDVVQKIRRDQMEGLVLPSLYNDAGQLVYDLALVASGGQRSFNTDAIISRYDQRISMTVLADFILLGHEKVGSFALSSDKTNLFGVAIGAFLKHIEEQFNTIVVPRLFALNGLTPEKLPQIKHGDIEASPLADVASYINTLSSAGMPFFPDETMENHLRKLAKLPERPEDMDEMTQDPFAEAKPESKVEEAPVFENDEDVPS